MPTVVNGETSHSFLFGRNQLYALRVNGEQGTSSPNAHTYADTHPHADSNAYIHPNSNAFFFSDPGAHREEYANRHAQSRCP